MNSPIVIRWLLCLFIALGTVFSATDASAASSSETLTLSGKGFYYLSGHMDMLKDPSRNMDFSQAHSAFAQGEFISLPGTLNAGYARNAYWIHFTIQRRESFPEKAMLSISPNYTNNLGIYIQRQGLSPHLVSSFRTVQLGTDIPVANRPVLNPAFIVPLNLPVDEPVEVFVRVYSKGSISLTGQVATYESLRNSTYYSIMLHSGYLGIAAVLCVMNLIFFISIRDRLFLYFSLYVLTVLVNNLAAAGMLTLIIPQYAHSLSDYMVYMGVGVQVLVFSEFSYHLFRDFAGVWNIRYMRLMSATGVLTMVSVPFGFYAEIVPFALVGIIILISLLLLISRQFLVSMPQSGIFITVAFGISALGYFYQILRLIGVFPLQQEWDINMIEPATLVNMVLISIALSERFRITERQLSEASRLAEKRATELATDMTSELRDNKERLEVALAAEHLSTERQHRFLTMLSHEYRTPLAIIQGNLDILAIHPETVAESESPELMKMRRAVSRLVDVMDVSLEQSRVTDPQVGGKFTRCGADEFVRQQVEAVRWMWPDRNFTLASSLSGEYIRGEMPLLNTALFNVLDNAQKYSPAHSTVGVSCRRHDDIVEIIVSNKTKELDAGECDSLFDKYRRGGSSHDTPGAGIGLWLVRQIIEQHLGGVHLTSGPDDTVTVTITLPLNREE
ncbi:sensor histidine kinase [Chlorobium phaeovibrioides]|nr:sensor histidine kinase [Chlorobium phaeovibrioides]